MTGPVVVRRMLERDPSAAQRPTWSRTRHLRTGAASVGALPLLGYTALSVAFFGLPIVRDPAHVYISQGGDAKLMIWFLAWWPYALGHGLNPLVTRLVWAPVGVGLGWTTSIPGAGILAMPITLAFGPVVAYNILCLLAPALAAWTAFLLCRYVTRNLWAALLGGYVFGFSTYELGHLPGDLNLTLIFLIPVCALLVLRYLDGGVRPGAFVLRLSLALVFQFSLSTEVFATMSVFGALSMLLALIVMPPAARGRLRSASGLILGAYAIAAALVSPYLVALRHDVPRNGLYPLDLYSSDLLNFLIPTPITLVGGDLASALTHRFLGNALKEAYLGLPLLVALGLFGWSRWHQPAGRWLILSMGLLLLATLGPTLHIGGVSTIALPWALIQRLPLINAALPARFMVYVFLGAAVIMGIWVSAGGAGARWRAGLAALSVVCLLPNVASANWRAAVNTPAFFEAGLFRKYLAPGENVLVIPYGYTGNSLLWQAQTGMYFRMASGYVGPGAPGEFLRWPIVYTLHVGHLLPDYAAQLKAFLAVHQVTAIVVAPDPPEAEPQMFVSRGLGNDLRVIRVSGETPGWQARLFATLNTAPLEVGGVTLYRVPPQVARVGPGLTALEIDRGAAFAEFSALLAAAETYRARGAALADLTPLRAEAMELLPPYWGGVSASPADRLGGTKFWTPNGLWLGPGPGGTVGVGLVGAYPVLEPVLSRYGRYASAIFFPSPQRLTAKTQGGQGLLLMLFTPAQLQQAARATDSPAHP